MDHLFQDLKYAVRALRKTPGFTAVAVLSLALGIGANTTMFTFVNAVLLRPLPYPGSNRIVVIRERPLRSDRTVNVHPFNFLEWRNRARSFEALALVQTPPLNVMGAEGAEQVLRVQTTSELFRVFGLEPALGRMFTDEETRPGNHRVVILGHGFWQRWFGGDPGVVGRSLPVSDGMLRIVGIAPAGFRIGVAEPAAYTPLAIDPAKPDAIGSRSFQCYGRVKPEVGVAAAKAEMDAIASLLEREAPLDRGYGVFVAPLHEYLTKDVRSALVMLMAIVAIVLLIACTNLGGLLLARGVERRGELALRASLGAPRQRIIGQLVTESIVLASCGGAAALVFASFATRALARLTAGALTFGTSDPIRLDTACLAFTGVVSLIAALVFGVLSAWQSSRVDPQAALRAESRSATGDRRQHRLRSLLVVGETALAVVLLVGAGLLLRTFSNLLRVDVGFQPAGAVTMRLLLGARPPEGRIALLDRILERVVALPGVTAAGTIQFLPLSGSSCGTGFRREGDPAGDPTSALSTECSLVSRGYFRAMGVPLVAGRTFDADDRLNAPRVVMVNQTFVRRYFPDGRALGRRLQVEWDDTVPAEIVGVVGDVRHNGLTAEPAPTVFLLHAQTPGYITNLVVRTAQEPAAQAAAIRRTIQEVDRTQAISSVRTMTQYVDDALARPRLNAALVGCFAALAVGLALIGVYGIVAYVVNQQSHEIGIRIALGATGRTVFFEVFGAGARLIGAGVMSGLLIAAALRGAISSFLFGVAAGDRASYLVAAVAISLVALAVVAFPARRAARIQPAEALRS